MNTHIDTLDEWWENAEHAPFRTGDMLIARHDDKHASYEVYPAGCDHNVPAENVRILSRAPKPAWHDAVAVVAHKQGDYGFTAREVYVSGVDDQWESSNYYASTAELIDPVPLIEQKVTDEMVDRLEHHFVATQQASLPVGFAEKMLNIALGLDPA